MAKKISLDTLVELPYNPRVIGEKELERLKASIKEHSKAVDASGKDLRLVTTVTVNKQGNRIVGGNQRVKALAALGQDWIHEDDVSWVDVDPDSAREKALAIVLNSDQFTGRWDQERLDTLLGEISEDEEDLFGELDLSVLSSEDLDDVVDGFTARTQATVGDDSPKPKASAPPLPPSGKPKPTSDDEFHPEDTPPVHDKFKGEAGSEKMETPKSVPPPPPETDDDSAPALFPMSYAVTAEQRKLIMDAITKAREKFKVETSADALAKICEAYVAG